MKLAQLIHVLRAASDITGEKSFVLVGSQAVLLAIEFPGASLTMSDEIDLYPATAPDKADAIDDAIGALSQFHDEFGYHADGVSPETAVMPADWMARAKLHYFGDLTAIRPEIHDLCVSKCAAMREKGADFVESLFRDGHVSLDVLKDRIRQLDATRFRVEAMVAWTERRALDSKRRNNP
jgi:hypothetical protein